MKYLAKLFKREIAGDELNKLLLGLGEDKKFLDFLSKSELKGYISIPIARLFIYEKPGYGFKFNLEIYKKYHYPKGILFERDCLSRWSEEKNFEIPYEKLNKNPVLKKYVKRNSLEKSLSIFSIASILASAFFISNNITGNAILTNNSNSSGIIGAGLFVLGVVSWIFARNI